MRRESFENIPLEEPAPPVEKASPQEITHPPEEADEFLSAENTMEKEKLPDSLPTIENTTSGIEKEVSPEKVEIMEKARTERLGILGGVFSRIKETMETAKEKMDPVRAKINEKIPMPAQELISQMMDVSSVKMYTEAGRGKTLTGKELSPKDRIISALIAGTNDIAKGLFFYAASSGNADYAKIGSIVYSASWALLLVKNGPKMMQNLKELAEYYSFSDASPVLARAGATFDQYGYNNLEQAAY